MTSPQPGTHAPLFVVQMHGEPGSGKSTLARALAPALPAIHLDKDILSSALIRAGVARELQGPGAYESLREVARSLMAQGYSVILDSPCFWPMNEEKGRALAADFDATWTMIECKCPADVVEHRLTTRARLESHPLRRGEGAGRPGMYEPTCDRLVLDSTRPVAELVAEAVLCLRRVPPAAELARAAAAALTPERALLANPPLPTMRERGSEGIVPIPGPGVPPPKTLAPYQNRPLPGRMQTICAPLLPHGREKGPGDEGRTSTSGLGPRNSELAP